MLKVTIVLPVEVLIRIVEQTEKELLQQVLLEAFERLSSDRPLLANSSNRSIPPSSVNPQDVDWQF